MKTRAWDYPFIRQCERVVAGTEAILEKKKKQNKKTPIKDPLVAFLSLPKNAFSTFLTFVSYLYNLIVEKKVKKKDPLP